MIMETQSQDEPMIAVSTANAVIPHNIKLEKNGSSSDCELNETSSSENIPVFSKLAQASNYKGFIASPPQNSSASYGDHWNLFASYSSDSSLGEQAARLQTTQIHSLKNCPEMIQLNNVHQVPSVPHWSSSSSSQDLLRSSKTCVQNCVPLSRSQTSVQTSVPQTGCQSSVHTSTSLMVSPDTVRTSVPLTASQTLVPCTGFQTSAAVTCLQSSLPLTNQTQTSPLLNCSRPLPVNVTVSLMSSQPLIPVNSSQPSVPVNSSQPSIPVHSLQPSIPVNISQPSVPTSCQPSSWYRHPTPVSSQSPPTVSCVKSLDCVSAQCHKSSPSAPDDAGGVLSRDSVQSRTRKLGCSKGMRGEYVLSKNEESAVMMKQAGVLEPLRQYTRKAAKACAEQMERTTRSLRTRQKICRTPAPESEVVAASSGLEKRGVTLDYQCPSPDVQELEEVPPAAQELKPRRMTRKAHRTKPVTWQPLIQGEPFSRWRFIGQSQGLTSDTEIAVFLMQHYENAESTQASGICMTCHTVLTLTCAVCQGQGHAAKKSIPVLNIPSVPAGNSTEIEAKMEPVDSSPEPVVEAKPEPVFEEAETDGSLDAGEEIDNEEEERPATGQRKRGRPAGSGKKKKLAEKSGPPQIRLKVALRKYKCMYEGCDAAFAKSSRLKIHSRIHTGEKPYTCPDCGKAFTQKSGLTVHSLKHTGLRPFSCQECGSSFPSSSTLKQHMRRHTGEKPFTCPQCGKAFRWSGHLTQHLRMHEGIKPFLCPDCGKSFSASSDLVKHRVTHTKSRPYKCDHCDKAYAFQHRLTAHQRSHTGDRPFLCSECGAAFSRAHNLTVHMRTHTGDKPYWCKDCGAKFSDSGNFCKHKKTRHGENAKSLTQNPHRTSHVVMAANGTESVDDSTSSAAAAAPLSEMTVTVDESRLFDYEFLVMMSREKEGDSVDDVAGMLPSIAEVVSRTAAVKHSRVDNIVKLPSMAKMAASRAKKKRSKDAALTSVPSGIPADLKSMVGVGLSISLPAQFSTIGSPPALLVHSRLSASPTVSPAASVHTQDSSGVMVSSDGGLSSLSVSQNSLSEFQFPRHDGVVFPSQCYSSFSSYCQQQKQQ